MNQIINMSNLVIIPTYNEKENIEKIIEIKEKNGYKKIKIKF